MNLWGTHIPFSGWTAAALVAGAVLSVGLGRRAGERRLAWTWTWVSLTSALALTLTPDGHNPPIGLAPCIPYDLNDLILNIFHTGGGPAGDAFNVLLLIPLTAGLVVASRRTAIAVAVALLLPVGIELTQTVVPGRFCAISDVVTNSTGGLLGVLVGCVVARAARCRARSRATPDPLDGVSSVRRS
jgi:hypothetical protein